MGGPPPEADIMAGGGTGTIGTTYLLASAAKVGTRFEVECRGERMPAEVVSRPFWKKGSAKKTA